MRIPILLGLFIIFIIWFQYKMRHSNKNYGGDFSSFLKREEQANQARKKEIPAELFITINLDSLPIREYTEEEINNRNNVARQQEEVVKQATKKMIRFDKPLTNTDIKLAYGIVNLDNITSYEENYNALVHKLNKWGESLVKAENFKDAEKVLTIAIAINSDVSKTYKLLADIYINQQNRDKLRKLLETVTSKNFFGKESLIEYIQKNQH